MVASVENVFLFKPKKLEKGCYFPASVFAMDILGNVVEEAGLGQEMGEPDRTCVPVLGSLTPSAADPEFIGQMLLTMVDEDGAPFDVEPRNVLNRLWQQLRQRGIVVVAVELEFYLLDRQRDAEGYLQPPCAPGTDDRNTHSPRFTPLITSTTSPTCSMILMNWRSYS